MYASTKNSLPYAFIQLQELFKGRYSVLKVQLFSFAEILFILVLNYCVHIRRASKS